MRAGPEIMPLILLYWQMTPIVDVAGMAAGGETSNTIPLHVVAM